MKTLFEFILVVPTWDREDIPTGAVGVEGTDGVEGTVVITVGTVDAHTDGCPLQVYPA
jgi:hypothetical protein